MADDLKAKGNAALTAGNFQEAIDFYTQGLALDSSSHVLYSNRSAAYAKVARYAEALADGEKAVSLKPEWPKGYSRVGAALSFLDRHAEAVEAYEKGLKIDPSNAQLQSGLSEAKSRVSKASDSAPGNNPFTGPDVIGRLAANPKTRAYLSDPDYLQMLQALQSNPQSMSQFIQDPRMQDTLSVILNIGSFEPGDRASGDADRAPKTTFAPTSAKRTAETKPAAAAEPEPELSEAEKEKVLGNAAYKKKDFEAALTHYDKAFELDGTDMTYLSNKAAVYFEQGKFDECVETCLKAVDVGRENRANFKQIAKAIGRIGSVHFKREDYSEAIRWFNKSLAEHRAPDILKKQQQAEKILKEQERLAYVNPEIALEEKTKGNEAFQRGDFPSALQHYNEAIKRNPDDAKLYSNRAACYTKLVEFRLGLADCETCIKLDPKFVKGYTRKGNIHLALKESSKAMAAFQEALALDPGNSEATDGVSKCYSTSPTHMTDAEKEQAAQRAMSDPEVQQIMQDPAMRSILAQMQQDPQALQEHLKNPVISEKIQKLMDAGLIALR